MPRVSQVFLGVLVLASAACAASEGDDAEQSDSALTADACTTTPAKPSWIKTETLDLPDVDLKVRVGTMGAGERGDVLYLHGFADRFDNHRPLLERFVAEGLRVITFDYPSHGETCGRSIDRFGFGELADLAGTVERAKKGPGPLYVAGWSTGGLLAVRMAQGIRPEALGRPIAGLALFAPGVDVRTVVSVTEATLTRNENPPHVAPPKPSSPAFRPLFAVALLANEKLASAKLPKEIPTLLMTGGEREDRYVDTFGVVSWKTSQRVQGAQVAGLECAGGFHELDNEPEPMGGAVRDAAARFLASAGVESIESAGGCSAL